MPYEPLHSRLPKLAEAETRSIVVLSARPAILNLFTEVLLRDTNFIERIKRHYRLFRATLDKV